jgi:Trk-type K+ transport system membrane component
MNLVLFFVILIISFVVVRIGAIAFELTGVDWSLAKFQALSCFTGTGFTTKESELITTNSQRRRIASVLMVLGNAGLVTLIATFANSLRSDVLEFPIPFLGSVIPDRFLPLANVVVMVALLYIGYKLFNKTNISRKLTKAIRIRIINREMVKRVSFEELAISTGGYGISSIKISSDSPVLGKSLQESNLREWDITILAIERNKETIPNPKASMKIVENDTLICFGKLESIRSRLCDIG